MPRSRTAKSGVDWMPIVENEVTTLDALAADTQAQMTDTEIENRGTGIAYSSGAIVGVRLWVYAKPEAIIEHPPVITIGIINAGGTIPTVKTAAERKNNEQFLWAMKPMTLNGAISAADAVWEMFLELKTARRFNQGDRFFVLLHNTDPAVAFGAQAVGQVVVDAYVRED